MISVFGIETKGMHAYQRTSESFEHCHFSDVNDSEFHYVIESQLVEQKQDEFGLL